MWNIVLTAVAIMLVLTIGEAQEVMLVKRYSRGSWEEGRLIVYYKGSWGTVCHDRFTDAAARVVCFMLGYGRAGRVIGNRYGAGYGFKIWLDDVVCTGLETNIGDCKHNGWGIHDCVHSEDVSISCVPTVKLTGGARRQGLLEVYHNGTWGTVCDDYFNSASARVVCNMLGYGYVGQVMRRAYRYGVRRAPIWLDDVRCSGTETSIFNCPHRGWGIHNCGHDEDVAVSCYNEVRLVGADGFKGRLEVYRNGIWGTVCDN